MDISLAVMRFRMAVSFIIFYTAHRSCFSVIPDGSAGKHGAADAESSFFWVSPDINDAKNTFVSKLQV